MTSNKIKNWLLVTGTFLTNFHIGFMLKLRNVVASLRKARLLVFFGCLSYYFNSNYCCYNIAQKNEVFH